MASRSYAWSKRLDAEVADTGTVDVPTPGFDNPANYDTDNADVVVDGNVMGSGKATTSWAGDFAKVMVTNNSGSPWGAGQTVYVTVAAKAASGDLESRVAALESQVADHETRIAALETPAATHVMAPETHTRGAQKRK